MKWDTKKLGEITIIKTGKLDSNAATSNGKYPFFTCDPNTLKIDTWAYDTEAVLLAGNNASGNYTPSGTITGGTIFGETYGAQAKSQLTLGTNDETITSESPVLIGNLYGLYIEGNDINFYDGILKGQTDGYYGKITGLPTGGLVVDGTETINEILYQTDTVNAFKYWFPTVMFSSFSLTEDSTSVFPVVSFSCSFAPQPHNPVAKATTKNKQHKFLFFILFLLFLIPKNRIIVDLS